jgi:hypothetical protein
LHNKELTNFFRKSPKTPAGFPKAFYYYNALNLFKSSGVVCGQQFYFYKIYYKKETQNGEYCGAVVPVW